ncbi:bifunctional adenosylcobinamide kinase/adenosylcobinamide-phosphate guanylyltransferase [Ruegeria marina]|uniref:bifunctional adenosylcobinamide kinase/adenosylcobinamide-phosphate guanylyltransferase n=1 Tax=Ruegeria marina TaxID=639004 RepID=UPI001FE1A573|nr:bifunctional adenosylcobinamide kinase/adenosylcobinamide-phosphate guanylyltransferase [Ruegeria marina]
MHSKYTLIIGGAASGKSAFAEQLVVSTGKSRKYLATSQVFDQEMRTKVNRHLAQRGTGWTTIEEPHEPGPALSALAEGDICLFDCATMWLSNQMLAGADLEAAQGRLLEAIRACPAQVVMVTNEVGHGIVPENALAREFREAQGRLNIALAAEADLVVLVTAGLPLVLKGRLQ